MLTSAHEGTPSDFLVNRRHPTLPIFELSTPAGGFSCLYSTGLLTAVRGERDPGGRPRPAGSLEAAAVAEEAARTAWGQAAFSPSSIVVVDPAKQGAGRPGQTFSCWLQAAARHVARSCQGLGWPLRVELRANDLSAPVLEQTVRVTRQCASEAHLPWNLCVSLGAAPNAALAGRLAADCDEVMVSCDRSAALRSPALRVLSEKLARARRSLSVNLEVSHSQLGELAEVGRLAAELGASVWVSAAGPFQPSDASAFATAFLEADQRAGALGVCLRLASLRIGEDREPGHGLLEDEVLLPVKGPPRPSFRHPNLRVLRGAVLPAFDLESDGLGFDVAGAAQAKTRLSREVAESCRQCFNAYHCVAYEFVGPGGEHRPLDSFECRVRLAVAERLVLDAARDLRACDSRSQARPAAALPMERPSQGSVREALAEVSKTIEVGPILEQALAVSDWFEEERRALPEPVWTRRGFAQDGEGAWQMLLDLGPTLSRGPLAVYVHVPFCDRRCGFCDCYSEPLRAKGDDERTFISAFLRELTAWGRMNGLPQRAVSTVHFGGGTPGALEPGSLEALVESCRARLAVHRDTEWAIESTVSLLTDRHLDRLWSLGFRRLHVGVQTLDDRLRALLGRRQPAPDVLRRISRALEIGFIVSVDLLYAVPGQTLPGLLRDVGHLIESGVHGFSLYQLQESNRNRAFLGRRGWLARNSVQAYLAFQVCEQFLRERGFDKNHFTHLARPQDRNLYYTHPVRGEDLLGLGPSADGAFGGYRYRHAWVEAYARADGRCPGLEGGVAESVVERTMRRLGAALMGGRVGADLLDDDGGGLGAEWVHRRLLQPAGPYAFSLTANGSWFLTRMLAQAGSAAAARLGSAVGR